MTDRLPIDVILPHPCATVAEAGCVVLQAPPGAGKTTRVPLALHAAGAFDGVSATNMDTLSIPAGGGVDS